VVPLPWCLWDSHSGAGIKTTHLIIASPMGPSTTWWAGPFPATYPAFRHYTAHTCAHWPTARHLLAQAAAGAPSPAAFTRRRFRAPQHYACRARRELPFAPTHPPHIHAGTVVYKQTSHTPWHTHRAWEEGKKGPCIASLFHDILICLTSWPSLLRSTSTYRHTLPVLYFHLLGPLYLLFRSLLYGAVPPPARDMT